MSNDGQRHSVLSEYGQRTKTPLNEWELIGTHWRIADLGDCLHKQLRMLSEEDWHRTGACVLHEGL